MPPLTLPPAVSNPTIAPTTHAATEAPRATKAPSFVDGVKSVIGGVSSLKWWMGAGTAVLGPFGAVAGVAGFVISRRAKKKLAAKLRPAEAGGVASQPAGTFRRFAEESRTVNKPIERDDAEAVQLLRLSRLEGRDPLQDANLGRVIRTELEQIAEGSHTNQEHRRWAESVLINADRRFNTIAPTKFDPPQV